LKEQEIQRQCLDYLSLIGFFAWKNHVQGMRVGGGKTVKNPAAGSPDILAIKGGKFYCIEVKTPKGKLSERQYIWLQRAHKHGAISMVVKSLDDLIYCINNVPEKMIFNMLS